MIFSSQVSLHQSLQSKYFHLLCHSQAKVPSNHIHDSVFNEIQLAKANLSPFHTSFSGNLIMFILGFVSSLTTGQSNSSLGSTPQFLYFRTKLIPKTWPQTEVNLNFLLEPKNIPIHWTSLHWIPFLYGTRYLIGFYQVTGSTKVFLSPLIPWS